MIEFDSFNEKSTRLSVSLVICQDWRKKKKKGGLPQFWP